jgi:pyridinium-3,5-bisthiocarboxylic acid mononucleotide nickel chelatase
MKTLYLDIFSGISGDMFIGALLDLGVPIAQLESELAKLELDEYHIHATRKQKSSIEGVKFDVHAHEHGREPHSHDSHSHEQQHEAHRHDHDHDHEHGHGHHHHGHEHGHHHHAHDPLSLDLRQHQPEHDEHEHNDHEHGRTFREIRELIQRSKLSPWVREKAVAVFSRIARAEGKIHGQPAEEVHFHEVGAIDSIVDIVGACVGLELLGKPRVLSSTVTEGTGFVRCAHGRFPIPAPATVAILAERGVPILQCEEPHELVTPTGAAILAEFVEEFGPIKNLVPEKIGYGLGERDNKTRPNVLRALLGSSMAEQSAHDWETDQIAVLETNLDDINCEIIGYIVEKALREGALDVFHTPIQMKKNRPGVLLTILCGSADADRFSELLLRETTALGVRRTVAERRKLRREVVKVETALGMVEVKIGKLDGKIVQVSPEFEACRRIAEAKGIPLKDVYAAAMTAAAGTGKILK